MTETGTGTEARTDVLVGPEFEGFFVQVIPSGDSELTLMRARVALDDALGEIGHSPVGWTVRPNGMRPGMFQLLPPEIGTLEVDDAWTAAYLLQRQASVVDAEPSFEVVLDSGDLEAEAEEAGEPEADSGDEDQDPPVYSKFDRDWAPKLIAAAGSGGAWEVPPHPGGDEHPPGRSRGEGVQVGHPDSGYREHTELRGAPHRFLDEKGWDFVGDLGVEDPIEEDEHGGHGLGTASVLMSDVGGVANITGVAPMASIVPYRVTRPHLFVPSPVLFKSGMLRLARSIHHAIDQDACDVISISLGWLPNRSVEEAVREAFENDVIVVAAAGNQVRYFVVWPAAYPSVIACAGCTSKRRRWTGSSRGKEVDVTGPAEHVWKAALANDGTEIGAPSDGTSFAAASVAGVAALWLAHWGKKRLLARYQGEFRLTTVFRHVLFASCDPPPVNATGGGFGCGIVNARRLLETDLPTVEELRSGVTPMLEVAALAAPALTFAGGFDIIAAAAPNPSREVLRSRLASVLEVPEPEVENRLAGLGRETLFHILTDPALRGSVLAPAPPPGPLQGPLPESLPEPLSVPADGTAMATGKEEVAAPEVGDLADRLLAAPLSARLRARLGGGSPGG